MLVSICMITYNHERYIAKAIEGVLMQQTNFDIELIISNDASIDTTDALIKRLLKNYTKIRVKYSSHLENKGMMANFIYSLKLCEGKYIAICEGDDYWTDVFKLQKQVDFMEANTEHAVCFHKVRIYDEKAEIFRVDNITRNVADITDHRDLAKGNYIHTPSVLFRNNFIIPLWFSKSPIGDWPLYMLAAQNGKIFKMEETMAVYRMHNASVWSQKPKEHRILNTLISFQLLTDNLVLPLATLQILDETISLYKVELSKVREKSNPLVSVCIPTFNGASFLREALQSVKNQSYRSLEIIISDDNSKDTTLDIVQNFKNKVEFMVKVIAHEPQGIGSNWNNCLKNAKGKYIKFLFQDDVLYPTSIAEMCKVLESDESIGMVASKREFILEDIKDRSEFIKWLATYGDLQKHLDLDFNPYGVLDKGFFKSDKFLKEPVNVVGEPSVVMFRKTLLDKIGYFNEDLIQFLDFEYWFRILKVSKIIIINDKLVYFRIHKGQATQHNKGRMKNDVKILNKLLYREYFWLLNRSRQKQLFLRFNFFGKVLNNIWK